MRLNGKQRAALRRLIRTNGLKLVAATLGFEPGTVARYVAGEDPSPKNMRSLELAFNELGPDLGLGPTLDDVPTPQSDRPRLRLVPNDGTEAVQMAAQRRIRRVGLQAAAHELGVNAATLLDVAIAEPVEPAAMAEIEAALMPGGSR